jgi:hypothetical protein
MHEMQEQRKAAAAMIRMAFIEMIFFCAKKTIRKFGNKSSDGK